MELREKYVTERPILVKCAIIPDVFWQLAKYNRNRHGSRTEVVKVDGLSDVDGDGESPAATMNVFSKALTPAEYSLQHLEQRKSL